MRTYVRFDGDVVVEVATLHFEKSDEECKRFLAEHFGASLNWIKVSEQITKHAPQSGFTWDEQRNEFIPPQPFPSWQLQEDSLTWVAPVRYPLDGRFYNWDEATTNWIEVTND